MARESRCRYCASMFTQGAPFYHLLWTEVAHLGPQTNTVRSFVFCSLRCLVSWGENKLEKPQ